MLKWNLCVFLSVCAFLLRPLYRKPKKLVFFIDVRSLSLAARELLTSLSPPKARITILMPKKRLKNDVEMQITHEIISGPGIF